MKSLEKSAEKDIQREEKLIDKIYNIQMKYKVAEGRFEYGEMNITKLNQKIDNIEDELASVGDNMKSLEKSAEKAIQREEKLIDKIYNIQMKYKVAEGRFEYG